MSDRESYCTLCRRQFDSIGDLNLHRRKTHEDTVCFICDKEFGSAQSAHQHMTSPVHVVATTRCPQYPKCQRLFKTTGGLAAHLESCTCTPITRQLVAEAVRLWDTEHLITRPVAQPAPRALIMAQPKNEATIQHSPKPTASGRNTTKAIGTANEKRSTLPPLNLESAPPRNSRSNAPAYAYSSRSAASASEVIVSDGSISDFELIAPGARSPTSSSVSGVLVSRSAMSRPRTPSSTSGFDDVPTSIYPSHYFHDHVFMPPPLPALNIFYCPKCEKSFGYISGLVQHIESGSCKLASLKTVQQIYSGIASQFKYLLTE